MVLLWLVPTVVVTVVAMLWVSWVGRAGRGEVDREVALRRLAQALDPAPRRGLARLSPRSRPRALPSYVAPARRDRSTGIAVRPSRPVAPRDQQPGQQRRAS
ncbi:hypothetical protein [Nocardioides rubriscoriae]|uniref:hypothetical protein n=1 Tax=Nocardioides rubriscoriae TaxID=642762 RepID=UPI0011E008E4|nr:hypothetical protein [Nocardioides rubriscoriae]